VRENLLGKDRDRQREKKSEMEEVSRDFLCEYAAM